MKLELPENNFCPLCGEPVELRESEGRIRPVCTACSHVVYINPIPAVSMILLDEGRLFLTERSVDPHKGKWCLPGGFLEWGEHPEEGGKRELLEETGLTADALSLIGLYDSYAQPRQHVVVVAYRVLSWTGEPVAGDDASEVQWFDVMNKPELAFKSHELALADALLKGSES